MRSADARARITPLVCELTDMQSVVACAAAVTSLDKPIDILMCNAGIMALPKLEQVEVNGGKGSVKLEKQFVVNHLGHYLLTRRILPQLAKAPAARIVVLSSTGYTLAPPEGIQFNNLSGEQGYKPFTAYGQSKLANALFAKRAGIMERFVDKATSASGIDPLDHEIDRLRRLKKHKPAEAGSRLPASVGCADTSAASFDRPRLARGSGPTQWPRAVRTH